MFSDDNLLKEEGSENDSTIKLERVSVNTSEKIESLTEELEKEKHDTKKISSFQTVFSIWNTMIGSSIVSIPYNVYNAGIIPTIFIGLLYGYICYLTCSIVVRLGGKEEDFAEVVYRYFYFGFGKKAAKFGKYLQIVFNLLINIGATLIYFVIINQNLYPCICLFLRVFDININSEDLEPHFNKFSLFYCAIIISIIVFPLTILKRMHCLVKFNSFGIYFVAALLIFLIYTGISGMANNSYKFEYKENIEGNKERYLFLLGENPGLLTGTLSIGMFCHSVILPLMKNNRNPANNQRDLFLGYVCVTLTYIIIGIFGYIGFSGSEFSSAFQDNWFRFFESDNYFIFALRLLNVFQLISIFPILFYVVRTQLFSTFLKPFISTQSFIPIIIFSVSLLFFCILILYFCYDTLGKLIGYIGAGTALILIYTIGPVINMINYYIRHQPKSVIEKIKNEKLDLGINMEEIVPLRPWKALIFYFCMMLIIILGIITLILQIMPVNIFGVKIEKNT